MNIYDKKTYWKEYSLDASEQEQAMLRFSSQLLDSNEYELANYLKSIARDYSENMYPSTRKFLYHD